MYDIRNSLSISRGPGTTAIYTIVDVCQFVCYTICLQTGTIIDIRFSPHYSIERAAVYNVAACSCTTVCANDDAFVKLDSHDRGLQQPEISFRYITQI